MEKKKMKPKVDPMTMLRQYMEQQGLRLGPEFYFQNFLTFENLFLVFWNNNKVNLR